MKSATANEFGSLANFVIGILFSLFFSCTAQADQNQFAGYVGISTVGPFQTVEVAGNVGIGSTNPGQALDVQGTIRAINFIGQYPTIEFSNTQPSGTNGGSCTTGSWQTYPLNTKNLDTSNLCTLSSNQMSCPAGTYNVLAAIPFLYSAKSQARLYNVSSSTVILTGSNTTTWQSEPSMPPSIIIGQFTLSSTTTMSIQYQVANNDGSDCLGPSLSYGTEVYGQVWLQKVS